MSRNGIAAKCVKNEDMIRELIFLFTFVLEREPCVAKLNVADGAAFFGVRNVGEVFATGCDVDDARIDLIENDMIEPDGISGKRAGPEAYVANPNPTGRAIGVEV